MWYAIFLITALVMLITHVLLKERREVSTMLRHTIAVNLDILKCELVELNAVAATSNLPGAPLATTLLLQAGYEAEIIAGIVDSLSRAQLQDMLTATFAAMNKVNEARHLLDACHPLDLE
jgi:hypothetical protein